MDKAEHKAILDYISEIDRIYRTGKATEHSYRGALQQLLVALMPDFTVLNEPKKQECGAPDYIVADRAGRVVSFVEAKDIGDADLEGNRRTGHKEQFDRYKASLDTIVFTDYLDFHLYLNGRPAGVARIGEEREGRIAAVPEKFGEFLALAEALETAHPVKITSATQLARLMAGKARLLQHTVRAFLACSGDGSPKEDEPPRTDVGRILSDFRKALVPDIGTDEFSDVYAQTITYGMFAARLHDRTPESFDRFEAAALIPKTNPFLKHLFGHLSGNLDEEIEWIVDDIAELFAVANVAKIMAGYGKTTGHADPMIHFYEDFLAQYDAGVRKDRGVWYTPLPVVGFIVRAVDELIQTRFSLPDGLADSSKTEIEVEEFTASGKRTTRKVKRIVHKVQILDPATGTGTFLAECVRRIHDKFKGNEGVWAGYVENDLMPRLNGFELLMASYTMAHIKLDMTLSATGVERRGSRRFNVFLTNSLTSENEFGSLGELFALALGEEARGADTVKRDTPVMIVVGNPPYSGESQNKGDWITHLMEDYKKEPGGKVKLQERNPKWLNDDYVKFLRLAEHYVEKNGSGIVAYINPHGFLDNPTFRGMRWHLMQTFDEMYFLNLHGNSKKKETAPDGGKDECVFNIMQGVSINLFVKKGPVSRRDEETWRNGCRIFYSDLWGLRRDKFAALETATMESIKWQELTPVEPMFFFVPKDTAGEAEWNAGFGIAELMEVNGMGVTTGDDSTLVDSNVDSLLTNVATKHGASVLSKVRDFSYRPFDERLVYYDARLLARARDKFWGECFNAELQSRRECEDIEQTDLLRHNCLPDSENVCGVRCEEIRLLNQGDSGNVALCLIRINSKDNGLPVFVTEKITDKTILSSKDNANVFPLWLYDENMGKVEKRTNLNPEIVSRISASLRLCVKDITPEDIFAYIYGVLHTPSYRKKFKGFLKTDFPRIPYPIDAAQFEAVAAIGKELIDIHLMRDAAPLLSETRARFPKMGSNIVEEVRFDEGRVIINAEQFFDNVPTVAWEMPIGGYRPAEKWLKDRKGRILSTEDIKHYQRIVLALIKTAESVAKLENVDLLSGG